VFGDDPVREGCADCAVDVLHVAGERDGRAVLDGRARLLDEIPVEQVVDVGVVLLAGLRAGVARGLGDDRRQVEVFGLLVVGLALRGARAGR